MLSLMGAGEYGLYSLSTSVVSYLSLFSFGMGSALVRFITKYRANEDKEGEQRMVGLFTLILAGMAVLVIIAGVVLSSICHIWYSDSLTDVELSKMRVLIILMSINTAISFITSIFSSIVICHERFIFRKLLDMLLTVLTPVVNIVALYMGFASIGITISSTIISVAVMFMNIAYCKFNLKIMPKFKHMPFFELKDLFSLCFYVFLGSIVDMLFWATDKIMIGAVIGTVAVAIYNMGSVFNSIITNLSTAISGVLMPKVTTMVFKNVEKKELSNVFIKVGRIQYIIIAFVLSGFVVFGRQFINIWVGSEYSLSFYIALMTLIPVCVPLIQNTGLSILTAMNKLKFRSISFFICAIVNVFSTYFALLNFGIIGAAACTSVSFIINMLLMNWYYKVKIGLDIGRFWWNIIKMSPVTVIMIVAGVFLTGFFPIDNYYSLILGVIIYSALYLPLTYVFAMNSYEKGVLTGPIKKIFGKFTNKLSKK